jgi:hypothetical protein
MESSTYRIEPIDPFLAKTGYLLLLSPITHMGDKDDQAASSHAT